MNHEITVEIHFFLISILSGGIILLAYDLLRILRRLIKHGTFFLAFEDLIFWIVASIYIFSVIYRHNSGIIRGFSVMGMMIGIVLYHYLFKNYLVDIIVKVIRILLRPLAMAIHAVKKGIHHTITILKKGLKFLSGQLKKVLKSVKISMDKKRQVQAAKRKLRVDKKAVLKKNRKRKSELKENQAVTPVKKEPVKKFERVNPDDLRHSKGELQKADLTNKQGLAVRSRLKHKIEIKR